MGTHGPSNTPAPVDAASQLSLSQVETLVQDVPSGWGASLTLQSGDVQCRLPSPAAPLRVSRSASRSGEAASKALGEVGGTPSGVTKRVAQHPESASTDGCLRRSLTNSEGAGAEREDSNPR